MGNSVSSISADITKAGPQEDISFFKAFLDDARTRSKGAAFETAITNERICRGDVFLDTYEICSDAISGGMGSVWRVHHTGWDMDLAMKRPQPRFFQEGSERARAEFVEECEHWIRLGLHPNIVACYYVREIGGVPSIFSEWMDNGSLRDCIRDGSLYEGSAGEVQERILDIAIQAARGLQYSHENGLVHQDMKPGNLLLTKDWEAKVADFGLARARTQITPGTSGYTPEYCPGEQMQGTAPASWMDAYAWALCILEMYTGKRLWKTGADAKDQVPELFGRCRIQVPDQMQQLLVLCLKDTPESMDPVLAGLDDIYRQTQGRDYPRPVPQAASETADSLNNYALSFLDLRQEEEAERYWERALRINPDHQASFFNRALYELRSEKKYDYQIIEDMLSRKSFWEDSRKIRQDVGTSPDSLFPERMHTFKISGAYAHAALAGECLVISDVGEEGDGNPILYRVHKETDEVLETDCMQEIRKPGSGARGIFIRPGGDLALVFLEDDRAALYDIAEKSVIRVSERLNLGYIRYFTGHFSRDGSMFAFALPTEKVFVLWMPSLEFLWLSNCVYVCRMPEHGFLFRRHLPGINDVLFTLEGDGRIQSVFEFDSPPDLISECDCDPSPFVGYAYSETGEAFYLSEDFSAISLPLSFFRKLPPARFYDASLHLLYTQTDKDPGEYVVAWDLDRRARLFTEKCPYDILQAENLEPVFRPETRKILMCNTDSPGSWKVSWWLSVLPAPPADYSRTSWMVSRARSFTERVEEEDRTASLKKMFDLFWLEGKYQDALDIFHECEKLPEFSGSITRREMEDALDPVFAKSALRIVREVESVSEIPEGCYHHAHENVCCSGNIFALYAPDRPREGVRIARPDGTLIRHICFPDTVKAAWIRKERIYAFSDPGEYAVYDLEGKELLNTRDEEKQRIQKPLSLLTDFFAGRNKSGPAAKDLAPVYLDLDYNGEQLLFARTEAGEEWIWQRNLETGQEQKLIRRMYGEDCRYLQDSTILFPETWIPDDSYYSDYYGRSVRDIGRYRADGWDLVRKYRVSSQEEEMFYANASFLMNQEKTRFFVRTDHKNPEDGREYRDVMAFDMDSEDDWCLENWVEFPGTQKCIILLPGCEFVFGFQKEKIFIFDTRNDIITPSYSENIPALQAAFRPDGREFYVKTEEGPKALWKRFRIEFDYA